MDIRYDPGQPIRVRLLDACESTIGRIVEFGGPEVVIGVHRPVAFGAAVRLEFDDSVLLGEVCACEPSPEGSQVRVAVRDAIPTMSDLGRLITAVREEFRMIGGRNGSARERGQHA
jgi:hypothetical protein